MKSADRDKYIAAIDAAIRELRRLEKEPRKVIRGLNDVKTALKGENENRLGYYAYEGHKPIRPQDITYGQVLEQIQKDGKLTKELLMQLECSRATYYRRAKRIKQYAQQKRLSSKNLEAMPFWSDDIS